MNQPDLGHKVIELRQQKGLTQEQLAELCEVSARTIQRIESGQVDPRAYTLQCLSKALEFDFAIDGTTNENLWLTILHLSSIFVIVVIPLLLWSWKKNQSSKIDHQGRLVLNFQVTMTLILISTVLLVMIFPIALAIIEESTGTSIIEGNPVIMAMLICIPLPLILIGIFCTYQGVVNAMRALADKPVNYALSIPFVK
jgi:transcriptional regulator with XRE-family HTH domain